MPNFLLSVNLGKLPGSKCVKDPATGELCVMIPVEQSDIYINRNQEPILGLVMWERKSPYGDSHALKQSVSKEKRERMGDAARNMPFIGNAKPMGGSRMNNPDVSMSDRRY